MTAKPKPRVAYVDATDFYHELGSVETSLYPSLQTALEDCHCAKNCGVVKVEVHYVEAAHAETDNRGFGMDECEKPISPKYKAYLESRIEHLRALKERWTQRLKHFDVLIARTEEELANKS